MEHMRPVQSFCPQVHLRTAGEWTAQQEAIKQHRKAGTLQNRVMMLVGSSAEASQWGKCMAGLSWVPDGAWELIRWVCWSRSWSFRRQFWSHCGRSHWRSCLQRDVWPCCSPPAPPQLHQPLRIWWSLSGWPCTCCSVSAGTWLTSFPGPRTHQRWQMGTIEMHAWSLHETCQGRRDGERQRWGMCRWGKDTIICVRPELSTAKQWKKCYFPLSGEKKNPDKSQLSVRAALIHASYPAGALGKNY